MKEETLVGTRKQRNAAKQINYWSPWREVEGVLDPNWY